MTGVARMLTDEAPGWPGIEPRWTSSAKSGVGTALSYRSHVWFTLSHGIFNEIYYPRLDQACVRDLGLVVTDGQDFFSEERRHAGSQISALADGVPAYRVVNACVGGRYRIEKEVLADPLRDTLLQRTRFVPVAGALADYHLYALLAPHLANWGRGNTAWVGDYKGVPMLFASRQGAAIALACSRPWLRRSAGFVGVSDGWQDFSRHKLLTWEYARAENGNVALTGEVDLSASGGEFVLALGFGRDAAEAGYRARASLLDGFDAARDEYLRGWQERQGALLPLESLAPRQRDLYRGIPAGKLLRLEVLAPAVVRWSADGWLTSHDAPTRDTGLGVHVADLPADMLPAGASVCFTFFWSEAGKWEGVNFCLTVGQPREIAHG